MRVFGFCMSRLRDYEEAQDAAQTTFMYVLRALDRGVVPRHEVAWLLKIAENVCLTSRRSLGRRRAVISSADVTELEVAAAAMSGEADTEEELAELRAALDQLPASQRRAILLREWQGLSYADIAHELRLSVSAVETLLFRARRGLAAYRDRTRRAVGALNLGWLVFAARSALQTGAATTAAAGALVLAVSPTLLHGDSPASAPAQAQVAATAGDRHPAAARAPTPAARGNRGSRHEQTVRQRTRRTARTGGAAASPGSAGKGGTPPSSARTHEAPAGRPPPQPVVEPPRLPPAVKKVIEPIIPPVALPPLPPLPPPPPLPIDPPPLKVP
jgi:RNA polymerase sigma factor (sigma-70 family)